MAYSSEIDNHDNHMDVSEVKPSNYQLQNAESMERKKPHCSYCKNHGKAIITRQHNCPYKINKCDCILCQLTEKSQTVMRHQQRVWRFQNQRNKNVDSTRFQKCDNCRNHLVFERKSSHDCPNRDCTCDLCELTKNRREIMKHLQRARRLGVTMQSPCDENENFGSGFKMSIEDYNKKTSEGKEIQRLLNTNSELALKKYVGEKDTSPASSDIESIESGQENYEKISLLPSPPSKLKKKQKKQISHKKMAKNENTRLPFIKDLNNLSRPNSSSNESIFPKKEEFKYNNISGGMSNNFCHYPNSYAPSGYPERPYELYQTRYQDPRSLDPHYSYSESTNMQLSSPRETLQDSGVKIKPEIDSISNCSSYTNNYMQRTPTRLESSSIEETNYLPYPRFPPSFASQQDVTQHLSKICRPKPILAKAPFPSHSIGNPLHMPPWPPYAQAHANAYFQAAYACELNSYIQFHIASEILAKQHLHRP